VMSSRPSVSVVVPAFNAGPFLGSTLRSILDQSCPPSEVIVVDDGSTDDTATVAAHQHPLVPVISQANAGVSAARNRAFGECSGTYIATCDADDVWLGTKLELQVRELENAPDASAAFCGSATIDSRGSETGQEHVVDPTSVTVQDLLFHIERRFPQPIPSTMLIRRTTAANVGPWDETLSDAADWDYAIRLRRLGRFVGPPAVLTHYRVHDTQMSSDTLARVNDVRRLFQRLERDRALRHEVGDSFRDAHARQLLISLKSLVKAGHLLPALSYMLRELCDNPRSHAVILAAGFSAERIGKAGHRRAT